MPTVTVWIATYNHERFIAEAIESVLMQETTYSYEIVIGEDCSQDRTREIVQAYRDKYPDKIKLVLPERNLGMNGMVKATYNQCSGKYLAWLDGDDYWTDPLKLQKQVDFLEQHPDYVLIFNKSMVVDEINQTKQEWTDPKIIEKDGTLLLKYLLYDLNIPTSSVLFRNVLGPELPEWYYTVDYPDLAMYFILIEYGKFKYDPALAAVYRKHKGGIYSSLSRYQEYESFALFWKQLNTFTNYKYNRRFRHIISYYNFELFHLDIELKNKEKAKKHLRTALIYNMPYAVRNAGNILKMFRSLTALN